MTTFPVFFLTPSLTLSGVVSCHLFVGCFFFFIFSSTFAASSAAFFLCFIAFFSSFSSFSLSDLAPLISGSDIWGKFPNNPKTFLAGVPFWRRCYLHLRRTPTSNNSEGAPKSPDIWQVFLFTFGGMSCFSERSNFILIQ